MKLFESAFCFNLAAGKVTLLKETPGMAILGLGAAVYRALDGKQKQQEERKREQDAQPFEVGAGAARCGFNLVGDCG